MPSLIRKTISGRPYFYLVWSARVNGKPRTVRQVYLGSAEAVAARLASQYEPQVAPEGSFSVHREFGASAALWGMVQKLGLIEVIDEVLPSKQKALSIGQYLALAAINRCVAPISKKRMAEWYGASYISTLLPAATRALQGQRFWDAMNEVGEGDIRVIEEKLLVRVQQIFGLDLRRLVFDATNFFTYIDTQTPSELARRGHNKAKRDDLRQVSLSLLITLDFAVPLLHHCYAGNIVDSTEFATVLDSMVARMRGLNAPVGDITIVFDKGNNSEKNFKRIDASPLHFVGSLPPSQYPDLMSIPISKFTDLKGSKRFEGVKVYRTLKKVFGSERTLVVTWNPRLFAGQEAALMARLQKKATALRAIQERLKHLPELPEATKTRTTVATVEREVNEVLKNKEVRRCVKVLIHGDNGLPALDFDIDAAAVAELKGHLYGRNVLFTDQAEWSNEDIILAYRSQYKLERQFRNMKDAHTLCWWPQFHWTDQKIRVHAFYCVIALLLLSLLQRDLAKSGVDVPIPRMIEELRSIKEDMQVVQGGSDTAGRAHVTTTLTKMNPEQRRLFDALSLCRLLPKDLGNTAPKPGKRRRVND